MPGVTTAFQTGIHSARPAANAGCIHYSCTTHSLIYQSDGATWTTFATLGTSGAYVAGGTDVAIADGGTGQSTATLGFDALSPMTTQDDIIIGGASGTRTRLAKGSDGQVLTVDPSTHHLVWATPSSGFADPMTTRGDIIIRNSSNTTARLGRGTATYVLTSDGTDIAWAAPAGGGTPGYVYIGEEVLGSAAATMTVTGIGTGYRDLICVFKVRSAQSPIDQFRLRVGHGSIDTGSNYAHYTVVVGTDATTQAAISATSSSLGYCPSAGLASNIFCTGQIEMVDYVSASHTKSFQWKSSFYSQPDNWTDTNNGSGSWTGTTAIDQVRLITNSGSNFATGSRLSVYGRL